MAEIHHKLKRELSLDDNFTNSKKESILSSFTEDKFKLSEKSDYISSDITQLTKHKNSMDISHLIRELNEKEFNGSEDDFKTFLSIDRLVQEKNYIEATNIIKNRMAQSENKKSKDVYLKKLIRIYKTQDKHQEALALCDDLIKLDPFEIRSLIFKAEVFKDLTERCKFIQDYQTKFSDNYNFHNYLLSNAIDEFKFSKNKSVFSLDFLFDTSEKSILLEPSLSNRAWDFKLDLIDLQYNEKSNKKITEEKTEKVQCHVEKIKSINNNHTKYLRLSLHTSLIKKNYTNVQDQFNTILDIYKTSSKTKKGRLLTIICDKYPAFSEYENNASYHTDWSNFIESNAIKEISNDEEPASLLICKFNYFLMVEKDEIKSLKTLQSAMSHSDIADYADTIINNFIDLSTDYETAHTFLNKVKDELKKRVYFSLKTSILIEEGLFDEAEETLLKSYQYGLEYTNYLTKSTYLNLRAERYTKVINIVDSNLDNLQEQSDKDILIVNKELAYKKLNDKLSDKMVARNIISRGLSKHLILAAHCLLDNDVDIKRLIKQSIESDYSSLYLLKSWPVIPSKYFSNYTTKNLKLKSA